MNGSKGVRCGDDALAVDLMEGRTITVPLAWYPRLFNATEAQRNNWRVSAAGYGIPRLDIDEDLSTEDLTVALRQPQRQP